MTDKGSLTLFTFKFSYDVKLHEEKDIFEPDGKLVAYICSNFQESYHPDYIHYKKINKNNKELNLPKKKSNKGRKPKPKKIKVKKKDNGTNEEFSCNINMGIILGDKVYTMKVFRVNSGNISSYKYNNIEVVEEIIFKAVEFINKNKPETNMKIISISLGLRNLRKQYELENNQVINIFLLSNDLKKQKYINIFGENYLMKTLYNNDETYAKLMIIYKKNKIFQSKILPNGQIYIYGGNDDDVSSTICKFIYDKLGQYVQRGYATIDKKELNKRIKKREQELKTK